MKKKKLFFEAASQLDELIPLITPTQEERNLLSHLINMEAAERYFFLHLAERKNSAWFPYLKEKGYFKAPPAPIKMGNNIVYPQWPALFYLAAMTSELPSEVVDVAEKIQLENAFGMSVLIGAFTEIPANFAPKILQLVMKWLDLGLCVNEEMIALVQFWAQNEQLDSTLALTNVILTPQEEPISEEQRQSPYFSPRAKFRQFDYFVEQFLKFKVPELFGQRWNELLGILEQKITQALTIEHTIEQEKEFSNWRPSIEPSSQFEHNDYKNKLLDAVIVATQKLLDQQCEDAIPTIDRYLDHSLSIFRRLAIHVIRENEQLWPRYLDTLYSDHKYGDDYGNYHEYWLLTQQTFSALSSEKQEAYLDRIMADHQPIEGELDNDSITQHHYRIYRRLWAIKDELSYTKVEPIFEKLREFLGVPDPPDKFAFLAYSSSAHFGYSSSKTSTELAQLSLDELLSELRKPYQSYLTSFDEPTIEGLATELGKAIKDNPDQFAHIAPKLIDDEVSPLYVAHAVRGFKDACKEKKTFNWEPVIELCLKVSQIKEEPTSDGTPRDIHSDYWWSTYGDARRAVVELLETAVVMDDNAIHHEHLRDIRTILLRLVDDPNPSPEYESEWGKRENGQDYLNLSLNTIRSGALEALIKYALHLTRIVEKDETAKHLLPAGIRLEPEVRQKLTEKLDKKLDPSKAVHVNFGLYLPNLNYLDSKWLEKHLDDIFPLSLEKQEYWRAAWDGYMYRNDFFGALYPKLKKYYAYAIEQLDVTDESHTMLRDSTSSLAAHLALLYAHGNESLSGEQSLVAKFLDVASDNLVSWFVKILSPDRCSTPLTLESDDWQRRKNFWLQRYKYIQASEQLESHRHELMAYVDWIGHIPESLEPFYEMIEATALASLDEGFLLVKLFEFLADRIDNNLRFIVVLYEKVYEKVGNMYFQAADRPVVSRIIETAICSDDLIAKESAIRIINLYGERSDERYRYLLDKV